MARGRDPAVDFGKFLSEEKDAVDRYVKSLDLGKGRGTTPGATTFDSFRGKSHTPKGSGRRVLLRATENHQARTTKGGLLLGYLSIKGKETKNEEPPQMQGKLVC